MDETTAHESWQDIIHKLSPRVRRAPSARQPASASPPDEEVTAFREAYERARSGGQGPAWIKKEGSSR